MEKNLYNQGWKVFGLYAFGNKLEENCQLCPQTTQLVEKIPGLTTAGFSRLASGTKITPHVGYSDKVLRCHLGLIVPLACALRVGSKTKSWQRGKCFIFDDTTYSRCEVMLINISYHNSNFNVVFVFSQF